MDFQDVVNRRRMVRSYTDEPVDPAVVDRMLGNALHAPSAGWSQGWAFLRLDDPDGVHRFWRATVDADELDAPDSWLSGMMRAPVLVVPHSNKAAYLSRYAETDKGWTDRDEARWPVPFWHMDAAMASLLILQTAVDEGLGACFFGIPPDRTARYREEFGVPEDFTPVGAITVGHRADDSTAPGSAKSRPRKPLADVVHHGSWQPG